MIRIGIICPSEIAFRRFLPALEEVKDKVEFTAIGVASPEEWFSDVTAVDAKQIDEQQNRELDKARSFTERFGGTVVKGYENLINSDLVDAVYIPLPPALHYRWAKKALEAGKHVFVEKPSTTNLRDTSTLVTIASEKRLALHENYMFSYHSQLEDLEEVVRSGEIGDVRLYRITFGFPMRARTDFRYDRALGGGALLDCGGYCLKYARRLLGKTGRVVAAQSNYMDGFDVDMYGSATVVNDKGDVVQLAFGMDNDYHCDIEVWGSKGTLTSGRILTAPAGLIPTYTVKKNQSFETHELKADDAFRKSIERFVECIENPEKRNEEYELLLDQENLVEQFREKALP